MAYKVQGCYSVFWTNHGYYSPESFDRSKDAIEYGKSKGFEFTVWCDIIGIGRGVPATSKKRVAHWSPIGGLRMY